ncbi:hypothetical protein ACFX10_017777 [Malus domestica]|uniref:Uncharacterized protein n=1 Tax=Malus domestica TaxID=3750 RepID=A0A498HWR2_MALDO|nr:hypothetical protein DVH24_029305 [Malus domestica]
MKAMEEVAEENEVKPLIAEQLELYESQSKSESESDDSVDEEEEDADEDDDDVLEVVQSSGGPPIHLVGI